MNVLLPVAVRPNHEQQVPDVARQGTHLLTGFEGEYRLRQPSVGGVRLTMAPECHGKGDMTRPSCAAYDRYCRSLVAGSPVPLAEVSGTVGVFHVSQ
jgi:hypothetical protein